VTAATLAAGISVWSLELLKKQGIAAVLLDLSLPARQSIENFDKLFTAAPDVPILIMERQQ
jgi:DNA-binding NarL/FixJ family response regulator